uniref:ATP synthase subunit a n=1 Tax=Anaedus unidentatus TaxID=2984367 RepID=A0A978D7U2_9CUCU|nr:ATP synthase F0 subunit 6 [Anaedus unidentatus]UYB79073.1 ATP synthase F0 subunit 6 [Anaedus unidentatus]
MMMNLFSTFDPSSNFSLNLNWMSTLIPLIMIPSTYWFMPSRISISLNLIYNTLYSEFKNLVPKNINSILMFISIFLMIAFNNFMGLFPFIFTSTSHMTLSLTLALPMWLSFMIYGWFNNTTHMLAHLVPQGTPSILMPFMVCIETISNTIRPMTLAIRLSANMIAGHLLMTLMGNTGPSLPIISLSMLLMAQILLLTLETAVALIQSYVFAVLVTLYSSEVN